MFFDLIRGEPWCSRGHWHGWLVLVVGEYAIAKRRRKMRKSLLQTPGTHRRTWALLGMYCNEYLLFVGVRFFYFVFHDGRVKMILKRKRGRMILKPQTVEEDKG